MRHFHLWVLLGVAALFRFYSLDHGFGLHPDERQIQMVAAGLNLKNLDPNFYAYGTWPIYILAVLQSLGAFIFHVDRYEFGMIAGRSLAACVGIATIAFTYFLSLRLVRETRMALLAAALLTFSVLHIQLSRYYTVDIWMTFYCTAFFYYFDRWVRDQNSKSQIVTTVIVAMAMASKLAGVYLILPWAVGFIVEFRKLEKKPVGPWLGQKVVMHMALLAFLSFALQPYLFLNFKAYVTQLMEQVHMVRGDFTLPYTLNYVGTKPVLYHLQQMFEFALNPLVTILAFLGWGYFFIRSAINRQVTALAFLGWGLLFFASVAGQQVKFPRYLLPIYPMLAISAAYLIDQIGANFGRRTLYKLTLGATAIVSLVWSLCFMNIFSTEHTTRAASRWILNNVREGEVVLGEHWDDRIPIDVRTNKNIYGPIQYGPFNEMPMYENDTPEKFESLAQKLWRANYIALPTAKVYGSILKNPDRYPKSAVFYRLLFSGKLGYTLIQSFKSFPQLGPFVIDDQMLDETLSVYDHPKAVIFKNTAKLEPYEIIGLINAGASESDLNRQQIMTLTAPSNPAYPRTTHWRVLDILLWILVIESLVVAMILLFHSSVSAKTQTLLRFLARPLAFFSFGYLIWAENAFGGWQNTVGNVRITYFCLIAATFAYAFWKKNAPSIVRTYLQESKWLWVFYALLLLIRSWYPDLGSSEKPMDFTFLNYFARAISAPYTEPWAAGKPLQYYYLGYHFIASYVKLTGIDIAVAYNLISAFIPVMSASALYALFTCFEVRKLPAAIGAVAVLILSNFVVPMLHWFGNVPLTFDLFWLGARTFEIPAFSEFPFWTFIFNDLHPHYIVQPMNLVILTLALVWTFKPPTRSKTQTMLILMSAFAYGLMAATNAWDSIIYGLLLLGFMSYRLIFSARQGIKAFLSAFLESLTVLLVSFILFGPYWVSVLSETRDPIVLGLFHGPFNSWKNLTHFFGPWSVLLAGSTVILSELKTSGLKHGLKLFSAGVGFNLILTLALGYKIEHLPWSVLGIAWFLTGVGLLFCLSPKSEKPLQAGGYLLFLAGLLMTVAELVEFEFRMNVIFKCYLALSLLISVGTWMLFSEVWNVRHYFRSMVIGFSTLALVLGFTSSLQSIYIMSNYQPNPSLRPTLNGTAFKNISSPDDYAVIKWINRNIHGVPVITETHGVSYANLTRVAMNTGLPTVVGWEHHIYQRGVPRAEIKSRQDDIDLLYKRPSPQFILQMAEKYGVQYIFVGEEEITKYGESVIGTFAKLPRAKLLYSAGRSAVYEVTKN